MPARSHENPVLRELLAEAHELLARARSECPPGSELASHTADFVTTALTLPARTDDGRENYVLRRRLQSAIAIMHGIVDEGIAPGLHDELASWLRRWSAPAVRHIASPPMGAA